MSKNALKSLLLGLNRKRQYYKMEDLNMTYIVESISPSENLVTIYYRNNLSDANKWAQFLKDEYHVETEIYTEYDYMKLHPEKFYDF